jgi:cation:H+ antiporter
MPDVQAYPMWLNFGLLALAAGIVVFVGTRLSAYADAIADRTGLGQALVGTLLLATATSLPEIATVTTASAIGSAPLAINNLLGGIMLQTTILVLADLIRSRGALTYFAARATLLLQGIWLIVMLAVVLVGTIIGERGSLFQVSLGSMLAFGTYLLGIYLLDRYREHEGWQPLGTPEDTAGDAPESSQRRHGQDRSTTWLFGAFAIGGLAILIAGTTVGRVGDALASQTGLGGSFIGATLVATATSLPEISTTLSAVRLGAYQLAISNIFGGNMLLVALLFLADIFYRPGPILGIADRSATLSVAAGILMTATYLIGMVERRDRTVLRLGFDSAAVLVIYLVTLGGLYLLR